MFRFNGFNSFIILVFAAINSSAVILYPPVLTQDSITAGDRLGITISIIVPPNAVTLGPEQDSDFGKLIIKDRSTDKTSRPSSDSITFNYQLAFYAADQCTIPGLNFLVMKTDSSGDTFSTEPIILRTISLITSDSADIKDLRTQQITGKPSLLLLWILAGVIIAAAGIWFLTRWLKTRTKPEIAPPPQPPYEEALNALKLLDAKQYLLKGLIREYVFELSEILKRYIGRRFETGALEFTTQEIIEWLENAPMDKSLRRSMEWFFNETEPVKFAKHIPGKETIKRFGDEALAFIEKTKPVISPDVPKTAEIKTGDNGAV
jgi:hypothetical protein